MKCDPSVLLIDDNEDFLLMWRLVLEQDGRVGDVRLATSTEHAIRCLVLDGPPSVVVADVWLDQLSGYDVADFVQRVYPQTPVVLTSAADGAEREAFRHGATAFVTKSASSTVDLPNLLFSVLDPMGNEVPSAWGGVKWAADPEINSG